MGQKIENQLNLAFEATEEERERSEDLGTGFDPRAAENGWNVFSENPV